MINKKILENHNRFKKTFCIKVLAIFFLFFQSCSMVNNNVAHAPEIYSGNYLKLAIALKEQNVKKINYIVKIKNLNLNYNDSNYKVSLLNWCIFNEKFLSFNRLLELGADPNWFDENGDLPPAIIESTKRKGGYLKAALKFGGNPNCFYKKAQWFADCTPLGAAIYSADFSNVKLLLENGADVNYTPNVFSNPLANAMITQKIEIAKYLLQKGADPALASTESDSKGTLGVLFYLRQMTFPLNSKEYQCKLEIINVLASKGLDYWKYPIPEIVKKSFDDTAYLSKY